LIEDFKNDKRFIYADELTLLMENNEKEYQELLAFREKNKKKPKINPNEPELGKEAELLLLDDDVVLNILKLILEHDESNAGVVFYNLSNK
jgi:hypothetical protein